MLQPYATNPRWFSYNGDRPVFLKSYYNKAGGSQRQSARWFDTNFYSKLAARGVNHHMASGFLPVLPLTALWDGAPFSDGPEAITETIYTNLSSPETSMSLAVWHSLEDHMRVLNKYDIAVQFFQGFNAQGPGAGDIQFSALPEKTKRWWVSYVVARLAPFANLGGYQYAWESAGNDTNTATKDPQSCGHWEGNGTARHWQGSRCGDYQLAELLSEMDVFRHMTTYEEMNATTKNHFDLPAWSFAAVEALGEGDARLCGGTHPKNVTCNASGVQNHHDVSLQGYRGKPVYMCEGHNLWRSWWQAQEKNVVRAAWAVTTAAASFTWSDLGHAPDDPYISTQAYTTYPAAAKALDVHHEIMTKEVAAFYRMVPADELLLFPAPPLTFCLAEPGAQYVVYSDAGLPFFLDLTTRAASNSTFSLTWFEAATGKKTVGGSVAGGSPRLRPPSEGKHWVALLLRQHSR